jgi:hypothetical protein
VTAQGEKFRSPLEVAEGIDASRERAQQEAQEQAAKGAAAGAPPPEQPPPPPQQGEAAPPIKVTPEQLVKLAAEWGKAGLFLRAKGFAPRFEPPDFEAAVLWAGLTAPCVNELTDLDIPWLGSVLRWGAAIGMTGVVFGPGAFAIVDGIRERSKKAKEEADKKKDEEIKAADVVGIR